MTSNIIPTKKSSDSLNEPNIVTFGCRLNAYESEVIRNHLHATGLCNVIVVNTCAVTKEAERQSRQTIRKLRREQPNARIIVTGCAAQINPQKFATMYEVDQIIGNVEKLQVASYLESNTERILITDIMKIRNTSEHLITGFNNNVRAFVEIQQGCNHRCSFCIIPFSRGPSRSVPIDQIVNQIRYLMKSGFNEIVMTGVDITAYGVDLHEHLNLGQMVRYLLKQLPYLPRLRLSSLDPIEIDNDLLQLIAEEPRLMPHFHLSIQSGNDTILKRMKRRYLRSDVILLAKKLRNLRPDLALGADIIAGFPTETEEMFNQSLTLIDEIGISHLHVFPFSSRPGTLAENLPHLHKNVVKERASLLRDKGNIAMSTFLVSQIGSNARVLIEKNNIGLCEHYLPVRLVNNIASVGNILTVKITDIENDLLIGRSV
ncbi:MAG: tRNA (N(6)-L-threonylcarbamoyladenosine(37)-C(2))-methylthiotransferase MtaB [Rhodospirillaceae bacterium]|jgi:threonylcarbamoyladenosine tRNA methylthiotransferase MtaB|nr:tRNA (N(6)-L-threonylcarbamoyladenosine(37)-C(2))-methylthiotransferase MtaB [Rhodospirillaceae bacterium]